MVVLGHYFGCNGPCWVPTGMNICLTNSETIYLPMIGSQWLAANQAMASTRYSTCTWNFFGYSYPTRNFGDFPEFWWFSWILVILLNIGDFPKFWWFSWFVVILLNFGDFVEFWRFCWIFVILLNWWFFLILVIFLNFGDFPEFWWFSWILVIFLNFGDFLDF